MGGTFKVIRKEGIGHHPHSLKDPAPIVEFVTTQGQGSANLPAEKIVGRKNFILRGDFMNSRIRFERKKVGHVAFIGGSITEMNGYRPMYSRKESGVVVYVVEIIGCSFMVGQKPNFASSSRCWMSCMRWIFRTIFWRSCVLCSANFLCKMS